MLLCSDQALNERQPIAGTAFYTKALILLPLAKRYWGFDPHRAAEQRPALAAWLNVLGAGEGAKFYVPETDDPAKQVVYVATPQGGAWHPLNDPGPLRNRRLINSTSQLWAICVHGQRDRCCARYGFAVWKALRDAFPEDDVLQVSHLGGDRYAATGLNLPQGEMLGWLRPQSSVAVARACRAGRPPAGHWRGNVFRPPLDAVIRAAVAGALPPDAPLIDVTLEASELLGEPSTVRGEAHTFGQCWQFEVSLNYAEIPVRPSCKHAFGALQRRFAHPTVRLLQKDPSLV